MAQIEDLINKAVQTACLERDEIIRLLLLPHNQCAVLFSAADHVRKEYVGDEVYLRGIVEFSNYCRRNCLYCGLRRGNTELARYRMNEDEIISAVLDVKSAGISTVVLQSGEDPCYTMERLCPIIRKIKTETGLVITLSIGERTYEDYAAFRAAGADRFLLKHETASRDLYKRLHPDSLYEERLGCLEWLKQLDYEVGTGNMVGVPGQAIETLADDILLVKRLGVDMIGIGPFIAHPQTPLAHEPDGDIQMVLKVTALARLLTRSTNIPATTAISTLDTQGRRMALQAGANVVMPDFTPERYRSLYDLYPGRTRVLESKELIDQLRTDLGALGRAIGQGPGRAR